MDVKQQSDISVEQWLRPHGFVANPFAHHKARDEADRLQDYFEIHPCFEKVQGDSKSPTTAFLFAARGCGKTASRMIMAQTSRPYDATSGVLAIEYTDFAGVIDKLGDDWPKIGLREHIKAIVKLGLQAVFKDILLNLGTLGHPPPETVSALRWLCERYCPALLEPLFLISELRKANAFKRDAPLEMKSIATAINSGTLGHVFGESYDNFNGPARFIIDFVDALALSPGATETPHELFATFVDVARSLPETKAVYVLMDELDEYAQTAGKENRKNLLSLLTPLTCDLRLLEMPGVAFKFFLPDEPIEEDQRQNVARLDRLLHCELKWDASDLSKVLKSRLLAFSNRGIDSLGEMADEQIKESIDQELIRCAGSPRELMRLGNLLLESHCKASNGETSLLSRADLEKVVGIPALTLNTDTREVLIGGQQIRQKLSRLEYRLLELLYTSRQAKSRDDIWRYAYNEDPEGRSDQAIDNLVHRTRCKIERDPRNPAYMINAGGGYYRLNNIR